MYFYTYIASLFVQDIYHVLNGNLWLMDNALGQWLTNLTENQNHRKLFKIQIPGIQPQRFRFKKFRLLRKSF